jgi:ADP-heptose:LPS heptosyltransferase
LVRLDGIGDALICAPLVAALRGAGHELGALFSERNRSAFATRAFARVHAVERVPWPRHGSTPVSRAAALEEIRGAAYDLALIVSEESEAYALPNEAEIPQRVGFSNGWEKPFKTLRVRGLLTHELVRPASADRVLEPEVETVFRLGDGLHEEPAPTRDPARLRPLVLDSETPRHGRVVVQLSGKFAAHGFDAAAFAALTRALTAAGHDPLCVADDAAFADDVARRGGPASERPPDLAAWKALLAGARAVVTPDSGAAHVAGMLGVPCLSIFPPVRSAPRDALRWRPWCGPARVLVASELAVPFGALGAEFGERAARELDGLLAEAA